MTWYYTGNIVKQLPENIIGFVYIITNNTNNKKYIGKKLARFRKSRPPLKGKVNRRKYTIESDWQDYYGSSEHLNQDVQELGSENFTREILYYCSSKAELGYLEAKEQFDRRVLETDEYYNGIINVRVGGSNRLRKALLEHYSTQG